MTDILKLASEAGKTPTLSQLSESDIGSIWADVCAYIERQMTLKKGVHLSGLGTFTFSQQKLDIGNKFTMIQRPIFLLAGKLAQSLGLKQAKPLAAATDLPVVQLNFTAVSQETHFSRDVAEGCVRETLLLLVRALASEQIVFLPLQGIGVLSFKQNKVRMKFNRDFINAMDGSGRLHLAFNNIPGSSASLMSGGLSRLQRTHNAKVHITLPTVCSPQPDTKAGDKEGWCLSPAPDQRNAQEVPQQRESKSHQRLQPANMKAFSLYEELKPKPPMEATDKPTTISPPKVTLKLEEPHVNVSCSDHARAGQELCYLCMQRAKRNVTVYLRKQQQTEEKAQEKVLLCEEQQRDTQFMEREQAKLHEHREHSKQVAAFNQQISEKKENTYCPLYPTSFIFPARPLTPARKMKQNRYRNELQSQVERQRQHKARDQQNRLLMEHLDQVQLVQELALQKAQQLQQKQEKTKHYKKALDTQVEDKKGTDLPECQPDSFGFSRCETPAANAESRERAQKLFQANFGVATQKKKEELHNRQAQLDKEKDIFTHNRTELILDRINHFEKKRDISKSLENEWSLSVKLKHQREEEEKRFLRSAGQLLVDKLAQYRRCCQCKRRTSNCGETNIWKDSHYLSGSQFMI
ncbi:coiled-coil domain-containing protein 81-like [Scomber scombrus]|uniref:coiled-coil domain-containing protein 81-like n=1 Tax=Scomber scombrus TaxID=13677 RepID=UPI002DD87C24|nr:coiled-coil domain-containing protein 81-like [Scomber scombrus]